MCGIFFFSCGDITFFSTFLRLSILVDCLSFLFWFLGRNILAGETRQRSALDIRLDQLSQQIRDKVYGRSSDLASMFTSFDTDRSGKVDFNEFRHGLRTLGLRFEDEDVKLLCNRFDLDGDGEIDYSEFSTAISGYASCIFLFPFFFLLSNVQNIVVELFLAFFFSFFAML